MTRQDPKNRAYRISAKTCKQIDYLSMLTEKSKPEIIEDAVDLLFTAYAILPKEIKDNLLGIDVDTPSDESLSKILEHVHNYIKDTFYEHAL